MKVDPQIPALRGQKIRLGGQPRRPQQRIAADGQVGDGADLCEAADLHLAHRPAVVALAGDQLDPLAHSLACSLGCLARGAPVERRTPLATVVGGDRATGAPQQPIEHRQRSLAFGEVIRFGHRNIDRKSDALRHQHVPEIVQLVKRSLRRAIEFRRGIVRCRVRFARASTAGWSSPCPYVSSRRMHFTAAHDSISVPFTIKYSFDSSPARRAWRITRSSSLRAPFVLISRSQWIA